MLSWQGSAYKFSCALHSGHNVSFWSYRGFFTHQLLIFFQLEHSDFATVTWQYVTILQDVCMIVWSDLYNTAWYVFAFVQIPVWFRGGPLRSFFKKFFLYIIQINIKWQLGKIVFLWDIILFYEIHNFSFLWCIYSLLAYIFEYK